MLPEFMLDKVIYLQMLLEEAKLAEAEGADYLGIGAVFPTDTKKDARSVSIELLGEIKKSLTVPVVGIGGISQNNAELLKESKIDGIAVVSAILGKEDIEQAAKDMLIKFK